ncbi:30S ribosomal protein S11-like protein [Leptotrombidium deliense]|uniref:30S ribosomal protein S11-like protein n=1 Tax=Leptotrombidium deliense TaxID=299467 RepID=A0A443SAE3_9ACAR|nr:30S ribosomal protein S11-like protein [Leptotrombidium deliense]
MLNAYFSTSATLKVKDDRKIWQKSLPKEEEGIEGTNIVGLDPFSGGVCGFPNLETPNAIFDGQTYSKIPVVLIHCSRNNTKYYLYDVKDDSEYNKLLYWRAVGFDGFKNCRKGTTVAAKTTAISFSKVIAQKGINTVRVCVSGLGPGRMTSVEGMVAAGVNIVSVSDVTVYKKGQRPRKARQCIKIELIG